MTLHGQIRQRALRRVKRLLTSLEQDFPGPLLASEMLLLWDTMWAMCGKDMTAQYGRQLQDRALHSMGICPHCGARDTHDILRAVRG